MENKFIKNPSPGHINELLAVLKDGKEEFRISYYPGFPSEQKECFVSSLWDLLTEETALIDNSGFRILKGDWRKEYGKLAPKGFEICLEFYESKKEEYGSAFSNIDEEENV